MPSQIPRTHRSSVKVTPMIKTGFGQYSPDSPSSYRAAMVFCYRIQLCDELLRVDYFKRRYLRRHCYRTLSTTRNMHCLILKSTQPQTAILVIAHGHRDISQIEVLNYRHVGRSKKRSSKSASRQHVKPIKYWATEHTPYYEPDVVYCWYDCQRGLS